MAEDRIRRLMDEGRYHHAAAEALSVIAALTAAKLAAEGERDAPRASAPAPDAVRRLVEAVDEIMGLIDDGLLVRNITNDAHFPSFLAESTRLVKALSGIKDALAALRPWGRG